MKVIVYFSNSDDIVEFNIHGKYVELWDNRVPNHHVLRSLHATYDEAIAQDWLAWYEGHQFGEPSSAFKNADIMNGDVWRRSPRPTGDPKYDNWMGSHQLFAKQYPHTWGLRERWKGDPIFGFVAVPCRKKLLPTRENKAVLAEEGHPYGVGIKISYLYGKQTETQWSRGKTPPIAALINDKHAEKFIVDYFKTGYSVGASKNGRINIAALAQLRKIKREIRREIRRRINPSPSLATAK